MSTIIPLGAYWREEALQAFANRHTGRAARAYAKGCINRARTTRSPHELQVNDVLADGGRVLSVARDGEWRVDARVAYPARNEIAMVRFRTDEAVRLRRRAK